MRFRGSEILLPVSAKCRQWWTPQEQLNESTGFSHPVQLRRDCVYINPRAAAATDAPFDPRKMNLHKTLKLVTNQHLVLGRRQAADH